MKMYCISDSADTYIGMRLAGVECMVVEADKQELFSQNLKATLNNLYNANNYAIILITQNLFEANKESIGEFVQMHKVPIVLKIPENASTRRSSSSIHEMIKSSLGI